MIKEYLKVIKILVLKSPKNFYILCLLLGVELMIITLAVFSLIPLADYILDKNLTNPSKFSSYVLDIYNKYNIGINFFNLGFLFIIGQFLRAVITSIINYSVLLIKYTFTKKINQEALSTILNSNWKFFSSSNYGKITNTFNKEIDKVGSIIGHIARSFASMVQLCFFIFIPLLINYKITLIILLSFGIVFIFLLKFGNRLSFKLGQKNVSTANKLLSNFVEILQAAKIIKINSKEEFFLDKYLEKFNDHVKATLRSQMLSQAINAFFQPIGIIIIIFVFGFYLGDEIMLSEIAAIFYSLISIVSLSNSILGIQINISNFLPSYEQVDNIILRAKKLNESFGNKSFIELKKNISFENICFQYEKEKTVLNGLNFEIKKNSVSAVVGESGSGKSTIADLLSGIITPDKGLIKIDNINLNDLDISTYRKKLGYVSQDVFLFNDSIKNNLKWIMPDQMNIDDDKINESLKMSNSFEFINNLPKKLDTFVGERGVQLSGGQRQRLSLARTFLKMPKILIMDEATSSLDSLSELEIQNSIQKLKNKDDITIIIIAHRLSTIKNVDNILVLEGGKISQQGNFDKLVSMKDGKFNIMLQSQIIN